MMADSDVSFASRDQRKVGQWAYFNAKETSVDVISEEEISRIRGVSANLEQFHEVVLFAENDVRWRCLHISVTWPG
jgi:hypothetical protein